MSPVHQRVLRLRRRLPALATAISLVGLLVAFAPVARAEDIVKLTGPVTDTTGLLAGGRSEIESAIQTTRDQHGVEVWVLFIHTTGDRTAADYASFDAKQFLRGTVSRAVLTSREVEVADDQLDLERAIAADDRRAHRRCPQLNACRGRFLPWIPGPHHRDSH